METNKTQPIIQREAESVSESGRSDHGVLDAALQTVKTAQAVRKSVAELALERIKERKAKKAEPASGERALDQSQNHEPPPRGFGELAIDYLKANGQAIAAQMANYYQSSGQDHVLESQVVEDLFRHHIYPSISPQYLLGKEVIAHFMNITLKPILSLFLEDYLDNNNEIREKYYERVLRKKNDFWTDIPILKVDYGNKTFEEEMARLFRDLLEKIYSERAYISLEELIERIVDHLDSNYTKPGYTKTKRRFDENRLSPEKARNSLGYFLYRSMTGADAFPRNDEKVNPLSPNRIELTILSVIQSLTPKQTESDKQLAHLKANRQKLEDMASLGVPTLKGLEKLKDQIIHYLTILAVREKINPVLEEHISPAEKPVTKFMERYSKIRIPLGKTLTRRKLEKIRIHPAAESVYRYIKCTTDLFEIGQKLLVSGATPDQSNRGELIMEMAAIYAERLREFVVEVEIQLSLEGFEVPEMVQNLAELSGFRQGHGMEQLNDLVKQLEREQKVQAEVAGVGL